MENTEILHENKHPAKIGRHDLGSKMSYQKKEHVFNDFNVSSQAYST